MVGKKSRKRSMRTGKTSSEKPSSSQVSEGESTGPSCVSVKSDGSMFEPINFGAESLYCLQRETESTAASSTSMTSEESMHQQLSQARDLTSCLVCREVLRDAVQFACGHRPCKQCVGSNWHQFDSPVNYPCPECGDSDKVTGDIRIVKTKKNLKKLMHKKFAVTSEGNGDYESPLNSIYIALCITTRVSEEPRYEEHLPRHMGHKLKTQSSYKDPVILNDIFKSLPDQEKPRRTVLTKGVAGIGKSFAVQKFILDWAEEEANQDVDFVFFIAFRELNLSTGEKSLHKLLTEFHPVLHDHDLKDSAVFVKSKVIVILDGLDESRLQLDFDKTKVVTSVSEETSLGNVLVNLIQGNLLPDARLWITSRPAAANQIPAKYVDMVTEIRGFSDPEKEKYFRRRFSQDSSLADRIISHIRSSQSLDIMCQIPIFCWITAISFEEVFGGDEDAETPQTLTEMMSHFLVSQTKRRSRKYDKNTKDNKEELLKTHREFLLKLGKLAFVHLLKDNLIFYEEDLENCGIDVKEASIYSGFCNTVLRTREILSQKRVFFVHLTIQEFFAALYVYDCFINKNPTEPNDFLDLNDEHQSLLNLLKRTVDKVMDRNNCYLDYFLQYLLGLMVEPNRRLLQGLLTSPDPVQNTKKKILTYLKSIRRKTISPDSCINLFRTMVEMRDHKVKDEIQQYLKLSDCSKTKLTPLHCSALGYMLQVSRDDLDVLDLKSYNTSDEGRRRLIPAVRSSRKAILADCRVPAEWVEHLATALTFSYSALRDLDLSNNDLNDSGVKLLCNGLSNQYCRLETLRLSGCLVTEAGCEYLASALRSNPLYLKELDLSYNHPGESGEKLLSELREDPQNKLKILNVEHGGDHRIKPGFKKYGWELTLDPNTANKNLLLSEGDRKVTWVEEEQQQPHCLKRFDSIQQVLCKQGLDGRCYWEVDISGPLTTGVIYKNTDETGKIKDFKMGHNDKSWCLVCSNDGYQVQHNSERVDVSSLGWRSSRVGLYLDWPAGTLSFYRVSSESLIHLHTFKTRFNQPLYPAVELHPQSSALFCKLS
ncbi:NLR family CARD domain-containing protein 3 CARD15-like protein Caterpiller protein 16.2 [Channa argus]|uniref:NLR family CARD domain-containing protein 3 CARD15-like protein Caterpiller protein 16.2 n=1 Tax=Channa argus TaxID=215402 RepID=A0A6G1Q5Y7_CHAAH|nr:NLR family CARD domain-containing protein 3 CARD15-like protein Caterpiller protein 16.2 [Channa argus]